MACFDLANSNRCLLMGRPVDWLFDHLTIQMVICCVLMMMMMMSYFFELCVFLLATLVIQLIKCSENQSFLCKLLFDGVSTLGHTFESHFFFFYTYSKRIFMLRVFTSNRKLFVFLSLVFDLLMYSYIYKIMLLLLL